MGERTLLGAERRMFVSSAWGLADFLSVAAPEGKAIFGIVLFDRLTWQQQMLMLEKVMSAMVDPTIPAPPSSALLEATVAAVYAQLRTSLEIELDDARLALKHSDDEWDHFYVRMEILAALEEPVDTDEPIEEMPDDCWPTLQCDEIDEWDFAIESLRNRILADEDWQMEAIAMDLSPQTSKSLKNGMGIQRDYFIDIPPDGTDEEAEAARLRLAALGKKILDEPDF